MTVDYDNLVNELLQLLHSDISEEEEFGRKRPLLAHYTSIANVESILRNNQIWLSNPLFMNDVEELRFGFNEAMFAVEQSAAFRECWRDNDIHIKALAHYNKLYDEYADKLALDVYILCLSEHAAADTDGKLSMWRSYGASGNGACIVIDTSKTEPIEGTPFILGRVKYASTTARKERIDDYISKFASIVSTVPTQFLQPEYLTEILFNRFKLFALFTKHTGFQEECEWRLVYLSEHDGKNEFATMIDYNIGRFGLEPRLKLRLQQLPGIDQSKNFFEQTMHSLIVGPSVSTPMSAKMIRRMLERLNMSTLSDRVHVSSIPYRNRSPIE